MFIYLLLILFLLFILPRIIRNIIAINRYRRTVRDAFNSVYGSQGGTSRQHERKAGWSANGGGKKKKIGKDVGEYVSFEEVTVSKSFTATTDNAGNVHTETEQQVTDVEWEDIK